jgi:hypothetical protein
MSSTQYLYSLSLQEEAQVVEVGYQRQKPYFGDPTRNINYSEGDLWELHQHAICAGAEMAFARMAGLKDFVPHYNKWKSELDIPGFGEVRYSATSSRGLRYTVRDNDQSWYVFITGGLSIKAKRYAPNYLGNPYQAVGWMFGYECKRDEWKYNNTTWYVPTAELRPMESLELNV